MGKLTTHVLDTSRGVPAANVETRLYRLAALGGEGRELVLKTRTNADGRCDSPLLADDSMQEGTYELEFEAGHYFDSGMQEQGAKGAGPRFLDCVIIRFGIDDPGSHYHVPLLISPFGYSTYRGS